MKIRFILPEMMDDKTGIWQDNSEFIKVSGNQSCSSRPIIELKPYFKGNKPELFENILIRIRKYCQPSKIYRSDLELNSAGPSHLKLRLKLITVNWWSKRFWSTVLSLESRLSASSFPLLNTCLQLAPEPASTTGVYRSLTALTNIGQELPLIDPGRRS